VKGQLPELNYRANPSALSGMKRCTCLGCALLESYRNRVVPPAYVVGRQAFSDRLQNILDRAPADFVLEEDGPQYVGPDTAAQPWRFGPPGNPVIRGLDVLTLRDGKVSVVRGLIAR